jgi:hypothetical protein
MMAPTKWAGRSPLRPWGAGRGMLDRPQATSRTATTPGSCQGRRAKRALTRSVPGGACHRRGGEQVSRSPVRNDGIHEVGRPLSSAAVGGGSWHARPTAGHFPNSHDPGSCQGRRAKRALTRSVPGGRAPQMSAAGLSGRTSGELLSGPRPRTSPGSRPAPPGARAAGDRGHRGSSDPGSSVGAGSAASRTTPARSL